MTDQTPEPLPEDTPEDLPEQVDGDDLGPADGSVDADTGATDPRSPDGGRTRAADLAGLTAALTDAERARDEYLDHLRRERAEFENYRRRANKERMEALDRGAEALIANLLGVLDNFGYVLEAAKGSPDETLARGAGMVHGELVGVLTSAGLEEVPGVGEPFDPQWHEAVQQVEAARDGGDAPEGPVVVEVLRPGYRFKGRVLRPASVSVAQ
jgi:molecular chaperone GrpE